MPQEIRKKIDQHRKRTDDLILAATVRMNSTGKSNQWKQTDALRRSLELMGCANHHLWLAQLALEHADV